MYKGFWICILLCVIFFVLQLICTPCGLCVLWSQNSTVVLLLSGSDFFFFLHNIVSVLKGRLLYLSYRYVIGSCVTFSFVIHLSLFLVSQGVEESVLFIFYFFIVAYRSFSSPSNS